jgi:hypothetical protein
VDFYDAQGEFLDAFVRSFNPLTGIQWISTEVEGTEEEPVEKKSFVSIP